MSSVHRVQRGERRVLVTLRAPLPHLFQPADNKSLHSQSSQSIGPRLVQDKQIGKKVLRVWGNIPSTNYLQLPRKKTDSLGLTGRFLYAQVKLDPERFYVIHVVGAVQAHCTRHTPRKHPASQPLRL